jgi:hypothetical protein
MSKPSDQRVLAGQPRLQREAKTVSAMIDISCSELHGTGKGTLCGQCAELRDYSLVRLAKCPFQEGKPTCANCRVHCYKPDMRERAREAMRTAGPRMPARHPVLSLWHLLDGRRKEPIKRKKSVARS